MNSSPQVSLFPSFRKKKHAPSSGFSFNISPTRGFWTDFFMCHLVEVTVWWAGLVSAVKGNRGPLSSDLCLTWDAFTHGHSDWTHRWLLSADTITRRHGSNVPLCSFYSWCISAGRTTVDWFLTIWNLWWFRSLSEKPIRSNLERNLNTQCSGFPLNRGKQTA